MKAEQLKNRRKKLLLSQESISMGATVSRFRISQFERGMIKLRTEEIKSINKFLKERKASQNGIKN